MKNSNAVYLNDEAYALLRAVAQPASLTMGGLASECITKCLTPMRKKPKQRKKRREDIIYGVKP